MADTTTDQLAAINGVIAVCKDAEEGIPRRRRPSERFCT